MNGIGLCCNMNIFKGELQKDSVSADNTLAM